MALAAGNIVYLAAGGGLRSDPPLFGIVDFVAGTTPDVIRVNWENGVQGTFAAESTSGLVEIANDSDQSLINRTVLASFSGTTVMAHIMRMFFANPDTTNTRSALLRIPSNGLWIVSALSDLRLS